MKLFSGFCTSVFNWLVKKEETDISSELKAYFIIALKLALIVSIFLIALGASTIVDWPFDINVEALASYAGTLLATIVAFAGSIVAIKLSLQAIKITQEQNRLAKEQNRLTMEQSKLTEEQNRLDTKLNINEYINPIRIEFTNLALKLNQLIDVAYEHSDLAEKLLGPHIIKNIDVAKYNLDSEINHELKFTKQDILDIEMSEDNILKSFEDLINTLDNISKDNRCASFYNFIAANKRVFSSNEISKFFSDKKIMFSKSASQYFDMRLKSYCSIQDNISSTYHNGKIILEFAKNHKLKNINESYLLSIYDQWLTYKYSHLGEFDNTFEPLRLCSHGLSHVLKGECQYTDDHGQYVINYKANIILNFILGLSKLIPSQVDVERFMKDYLNCNPKHFDGFMTHRFDASCFLTEEIQLIRNNELIFKEFSQIIEKEEGFFLGNDDETE